jgi:hypothetical protein
MSNILKLNYFTDPGHGWVAIKLNQLEKLGLIDQISHYSYIKGKSAYLEEDCDLGLLFKACDNKGIQIQTFSKHTNNRSKIRSFDHYSPSKARAALLDPLQFMREHFIVVHVGA